MKLSRKKHIYLEPESPPVWKMDGMEMMISPTIFWKMIWETSSNLETLLFEVVDVLGTRSIHIYTHSWNLKRPFLKGCFNWMMVPKSLRMETGWKSPFPSINKNCLFRVPGSFSDNNSSLSGKTRLYLGCANRDEHSWAAWITIFPTKWSEQRVATRWWWFAPCK